MHARSSFHTAVCTAVLAAAFFLVAPALAQTPAPTFDPPGGFYPVWLDVLISGSGGATLHYTRDGTEPNPGLPVPGSGTVRVGQSLVLKARATDGGGASAVGSATYSISGAVYAGGAHALALKSDGKLWSWGAQGVGRLGNGLTATANVASPVRVKKAGGTNFDDAIAAAGGYAQSLAVDREGQAWAFGFNVNGELGNRTTTDSGFAVRVEKGAVAGSYLGDIEQVATGNAFSMALDGSGAVWSWGNSGSGRLANGLSTGLQRYAAQATRLPDAGETGFPNLTNIAGITAGETFGMARDHAGNLWSWGYNTSGQLGNGNTTNTTRAARVKRDASNVVTEVAGISAGIDFSVALRKGATQNGTVWAWGQQGSGRLGNGVLTTGLIYYPVQVQKSPSGYLDRVVQISTGPYHTLALDEDGNVWSWGYNDDSQLGHSGTTTREKAYPVLQSNGQPLSGVVSIAAGGFVTRSSGAVTAITSSSYALKSDGSLYAWGNNAYGQLAIPVATVIQPTAIAAGGTLRLTNQPPSVSLAVTPSASQFEPAAFTLQAYPSDADGNIVGVAFFSGNTKLGDANASNAFVWSNVPANPAGQPYALRAVVTDGEGLQGESTIQSRTVTRQSVSIIAQVATVAETSATPGAFRISRAVGAPSTASLMVNFLVTGTATNGTDFQSTSESIVIPAGGNYADVAIQPIADRDVEGNETVIVTLLTGNYDIGSGSASMTLADRVPVMTPVFSTDAGASFRTECVMVSCGTPGAVIRYTTDGTEPTPASPTIASGNLIRVPASGILAARAYLSGSPESDVNSGSYGGGVFESRAKVAAGQFHSMVLLGDGSLWAVGRNTVGQLGNGTILAAKSPVRIGGGELWRDVSTGPYHTVTIRNDGTVWACGYNGYGALKIQVGVKPYENPLLLPTPALTGDYRRVAAGSDHTLALRSDGTVWAWGSNSAGQLGCGNTAVQSGAVQVAMPAGVTIVEIAACGSTSAAVASDGKAYVWGQNSYGQFGNSNTASSAIPIRSGTFGDIVSLALGTSHLLVLRADSTVWGAGSNYSGQLGDGTSSPRYVFVQAGGLNFRGVVAVAAGLTHSIARKADHSTAAWGSNTAGQLADGTNANRYAPATISAFANGVSFAGGDSHTLFLAPHVSGALFAYAVGNNSDGQLGDGTTVSRLTVAHMPLGSDFDGDGLTDMQELALGSNIAVSDTNGDGISDSGDLDAGLSPTSLDSDSDGLSNTEETALGTNPFSVDSDGDGVADGSDAFPNDSGRSAAPAGDTTPPEITITFPLHGISPL